MKTNYGAILFPGDCHLPLDLSAGGFTRAELEIGFGNGEFTVKYAAAHPEVFLIGMEVSPSCVLRCARRSAGLPNLKILCTDARCMMKELFADGTLDRVIMNFPCPWPKKRHARRRVTARGFADDLAAVLKTGGAFELITDEEWYALSARESLGRHEALSVQECETNPARPVTTKYERKWLAMGKNITRLIVTKTKNFTVKRGTWNLEDREMHVKTNGPLREEALLNLYDAASGRKEARWVFKKHFRDETPGTPRSWLIETVSTDDEFEQRFYLKVVERGAVALIKLDGTARVYLTPAVRYAIDDLRRRLDEPWTA